MSRENTMMPTARSMPMRFQSAPGSMSRENDPEAQHDDAD